MHWARSPHSQYPGLHTGVELAGPGPGHGTELGIEMVYLLAFILRNSDANIPKSIVNMSTCHVHL